MRGAYPSPAFSEKHTGRHFSQLVWVADAEVNTFGGISARNAVLVYIGEKGCKIQSQNKKKLHQSGQERMQSWIRILAV